MRTKTPRTWPLAGPELCQPLITTFRSNGKKIRSVNSFPISTFFCIILVLSLSFHSLSRRSAEIREVFYFLIQDLWYRLKVYPGFMPLIPTANKPLHNVFIGFTFLRFPASSTLFKLSGTLLPYALKISEVDNAIILIMLFLSYVLGLEFNGSKISNLI